MTDNRFFDAHQRATVEAAMARMIPTDDTPGAREAGTVDFLDRYLSGIDFVFAKLVLRLFVWQALQRQQHAGDGVAGVHRPHRLFGAEMRFRSQ